MWLKMAKTEKTEKTEKPVKHEDRDREKELIRIAATDIPGNLSIYAGLTKIKGISWAFSNAICRHFNFDRKRKISTITDEEIKKILDFIKKPNVPEWLLNRRKDIETGKNKHLITTDLDLEREFDIRRMKKIRSYKGIRHGYGLPVRGQRTRAHFRKGKAIGVVRAKVKPGKKR